jgi:hypothetical protein
VLRGSFCLHQCPALPRQGEGCAARCSESREGTLINRHRRKVPVRLTSVPVQDADGALLCTLDVVEDLSALKELEGRLTRTAGPGAIVGRSAPMEHLLRILPAVAQSDAAVCCSPENPARARTCWPKPCTGPVPAARESFVRVNAHAQPEALLDVRLFGQAASEGRRPAPSRQVPAGPKPARSIFPKLPTCRGPAGTAVAPAGRKGRGAAGRRAPHAPERARGWPATRRDPEALAHGRAAAAGLFHRLNAVRLHLPPLRERGRGRAVPVDAFLGLFATKLRKQVLGFFRGGPPAAVLLRLPRQRAPSCATWWRYAVMVCADELVLPEHLPPHVRFRPESPEQAPEALNDATPRPRHRKKA